MQNAELDIMLIGQMFLEEQNLRKYTSGRTRVFVVGAPVTLSSQSITLDLPFLRVAAAQRH
jgi:hypothetical protein